MNFAFAYPWVLVALLIVPALAFFRFAPRFRRARQGTFLFSQASFLKTQPRSFRHYLMPLLDVLTLAAIALVIFALARPQTTEFEEVDVEGIDIFVALDMSGSMRAIDLDEQEVRRLERLGKEPVNRFDSAVQTLRDFVKSREHDRIGIVLFAREAFLHFPLTLDHNMVAQSLDHLRLADIDEAGTAIGNALGRSIAGLAESTADTKILILITDGDRRGGNISPQQAAEMAKKLGIVVYPILVGRDGLAMVPVGRDIFSGRTSYRKVEFPIDPALLEEIAQITDGRYFRAQDGASMRDDLKTILDEYDRSRLEDISNVEHRELYRPLVFWALLLLSAQFLLRHTLCRTYP
ncbi:MAG: VWA domain-containing protein [Bradymonadaceae bacterium]|nr:VWA domain-containing protein [Lujinxingiaceae bacterium]